MEQKPGYEYSLKQTSQFKKDLKAVKFDEHKLDELHIEDDFLLIWKDPEQKVIRLIRLGSHSKLFNKKRKRK